MVFVKLNKNQIKHGRIFYYKAGLTTEQFRIS